MRLLVIAIALAGCHRETGEAPGRFPVPLVAQAPETDVVVATVDGRPIHASDVALQARAHGSDARGALAELIDAEALAGEASRRGLDHDRDAEEAAEATAVRRLLAASFESEVTPATVPETLLSRVYEKNRGALDHDVEIDVWHLLVPTRNLTAEQKQAAQAIAEDLAKRARSAGSLEKFQALAATVNSTPPVKYEHVVTERDGWTLKEFSHPAFDQLHKPGDTSTVIETSYGYHILFLVGFRPARHTSLAEATPELRKGIFPDFQRQEFVRWTDRMTGNHQIDVHPERLK